MTTKFSFTRPLAGLSLGHRMTLGFVTMLVLLVAVAAMGALAMRATGADLRAAAESHRQHANQAQALMVTMAQLGLQVRSQGTVAVADIKLTETALADITSGLRSHASDAEELRLLDAISSAESQVLPLAEQLARPIVVADATDAAAVLQAQQQRARTIATQLQPAEANWREQVQAYQRWVTEQDSQAATAAAAAQQQYLWAVAALVVLAVVTGTAIGVLLMRSIRQPIDETTRIAERIAEGDLTADLDVTGEDELGRLQRAVAQMQDRLRAMVGNIRETSDSISTASSEIAAGNADLSNRTEQTSGSVQQAAASMEQISGNMRETALSARSANELVASAVAAAQRGGEVVAQVVANMEEISSSSRKIGEIITVIDGIAFQTNLLALNAAVEAARAGEHGKGFAVVAGEVRNLAQRAANAAKEIKGLINTSVEKVESGGQLVRDAGSTMEHIVSSVQSVTEIIGRISSHTGEQSEGLQQVSHSVGKLDEMTQRNAALVTESASAAEALRSQAERLQKVVGAFRLLQQTQEAAWTAHTAITSARVRSKAGAAGASSGEAVWGQDRRRSAPGGDAPPAAKGDWENF